MRYYASGRSDFQSAQIVLLTIGADREDYRHKSAAFLAGFALELLLKAWLAADGVEESVLRSNQYRHCLGELFALAIERGYTPSSGRLPELISLFDRLHATYETRYLREATAVPTLVLTGYTEVMQSFDDDVRSKLGLPPAPAA